MFKKQLLAASVLALTAGIAFADNEAGIMQSAGDANTATIEQISGGDAVAAQIIQAGSATGTAAVYQGITSATGAGFDTKAAIDSQSAYGKAAGAQVDLTSDSFADPSAQAVLSTTVNDLAVVKQGALTDAGIAKVIQATGDDLANNFDPTTALIGSSTLTNTSGVDTGVFNFGTFSSVTADISAGTDNVDNIGLVSQGVAGGLVTRDGNALADAAAAATHEALIVQAGAQLTAVVLQQGAASATVLQAGTGNDAYVVQYGDGDTNAAYVVQTATNDIATVYQTGSNANAAIYQH